VSESVRIVFIPAQVVIDLDNDILSSTAKDELLAMDEQVCVYVCVCVFVCVLDTVSLVFCARH
jgi:hypothetical protein